MIAAVGRSPPPAGISGWCMCRAIAAALLMPPKSTWLPPRKTGWADDPGQGCFDLRFASAEVGQFARRFGKWCGHGFARWRRGGGTRPAAGAGALHIETAAAGISRTKTGYFVVAPAGRAGGVGPWADFDSTGARRAGTVGDQAVKPPPPPFPQQRLRELSWNIAQGFPRPFGINQIHFAFVQPGLGLLWWHVSDDTAAAARREWGSAGAEARPVVRVYDVTDLLFDGHNAHGFFDLEVGSLQGNYYLRHKRLGRSLLAEMGLRTRAGVFRALARSAAVRFDRDRPSGDFRRDGLFVARDFRLIFPVENISDARIFERLHRELPDFPFTRQPRVAVVYLGWGEAADFGGTLGATIRRTGEALGRMGVELEHFALAAGEPPRRRTRP